MARDKTDKTDTTPAATSAIPNFRKAVAMTKERLSSDGTFEIKSNTRQLLALRLVIDAEARSLNGNWIGDRKLLAIKVRDDALDISQLVEAAEWHPLAFEAAGILSARILERGDTLPHEPLRWAIEALQGKQAPPLPRNQRKGIKNEDWWHKFYVWKAVINLIELGMKPTRNAANEPCSACDAVAAAMKELGLHPMFYSGVYDVWKAYQNMKKGS